jgi:hypothetical protein
MSVGVMILHGKPLVLYEEIMQGCVRVIFPFLLHIVPSHQLSFTRPNTDGKSMPKRVRDKIMRAHLNIGRWDTSDKR